MNLEEKKLYTRAAMMRWTDGEKTLYGIGFDGEDEGDFPTIVRYRLFPQTISAEDGYPIQDDVPEYTIRTEELIEKYEPITDGVKFVVCAIMDQTYGFLSQDQEDGLFFDVKRGPAVLYDSLSSAIADEAAHEGDFIEAIYDVEEFKSLPDTW